MLFRSQTLSETNPAAGSRFQYASREYDAATGQYYNRARYYSPSTGRFTSQDPLKFGGGDVNTSRYVGNAPTQHVDPTGEFPPIIWGGIAFYWLLWPDIEKGDPAALGLATAPIGGPLLISGGRAAGGAIARAACGNTARKIVASGALLAFEAGGGAAVGAGSYVAVEGGWVWVATAGAGGAGLGLGGGMARRGSPPELELPPRPFRSRRGYTPHSVCPDGTIVVIGDRPPFAQPVPGIGPHSVIRWDMRNTRIYGGKTFDCNGRPVVDWSATQITSSDGRPRPDHLPGPNHQFWTPGGQRIPGDWPGLPNPYPENPPPRNYWLPEIPSWTPPPTPLYPDGGDDKFRW